MSKKQKVPGAELFDQYFSSVYGEIWPELKQALLNNECKVGRANAFYQEEPSMAELTAADNKWGLGEKLSSNNLQNCFALKENFDLANFSSQILPFYRMDPASIIAAKALPVKPGDDVLDMCAAPGGKTLVLMEALQGQGRLVANELSAKRRFRMMSVFKRYLSPEARSMVVIKGIDGGRFGLGKARFDKILLDAPCSGERGVINKASDLDQWKEKRSKSFAIRQYALLSSAFMALKEGGHLLYSTCSISPHENDGVIAKLKKRQPDLFKIHFHEQSHCEKTEFGHQFLPTQVGWGPIYFSHIEKLQMKS